MVRWPLACGRSPTPAPCLRIALRGKGLPFPMDGSDVRQMAVGWAGATAAGGPQAAGPAKRWRQLLGWRL